jgi:putative transposase
LRSPPSIGRRRILPWTGSGTGDVGRGGRRCSTNAIESLNARYRRAVKARGHFPTELAALKCLYLVTRALDPTGKGRTRWAMRWKPALNAFAITFTGRIVPSNGS